MNRRVLLVSPHFPPINAPDHQRVRIALPYFEEFGWDVHILAVRPEDVQGVSDPLLAKTLPPHLQVTRVKALPIQYTRYLGLGNIGWRSIPYLATAGHQLLKQTPFDVVYFSTTVFLSMALGAPWLKRFGVPYVLDFQDPWLSDYYQQPDTGKPPGGWLKYGFAQQVAQFCEPRAMRHVSHITSVSPAYGQTLRQRYPWLQESQFTVLPFGASETDFKLLPSLQVKQSIFDPNDGKRHWVYVGRGGRDMALALKSLFLGLQTARQHDPQRWQQVQLHFVGTSYAPQARAQKTVEPIAQACGVPDLVQEVPQRVPYFEALQILSDSDAIILIGSDDPGYSASKLYPCILARKPILAVFHQQSAVVDILRRCQAGEAVTFDAHSQPSELAGTLSDKLTHLLSAVPPNTDWEAFAPYTARKMTAKLCELFERVAQERDR